jgi:ethanolamine utilization microcompartment shell protein EutS
MSLHEADDGSGLAAGTDLSSARELVESVVYRHPLVGRILSIEVTLLSLAVVAALVGTRTQTHGVGLLNLLSGLLIVTAMIVAVVSVVAGVVVTLHRAVVDLRREYSPV